LPWEETVIVILRLNARPDAVAKLQPILTELAAQSRKESDCISYRVVQNKADPCDFTLLEEWTNEAALDAHLAKPHVQTALAQGGPLLAKGLDVRRCVAIA
jgi:quinol monooxygenase YgiN